MKSNRIFSYVVVFLVYIIASIVGVLLYNRLSFHFALNLLIADMAATIIVFIFSVIFKNASVYDPYWSVQPIVIVACLFFNHDFSIVNLFPLIAILLWGIRLTLNWAYTFSSLKHQDWRYTMLKEKTGLLYPIINFLGIHSFPTIVVYLCVLPSVYLYYNDVVFNPISLVFFSLSIIATIIQTIADFQMHRFRKQKTGKFIRYGLWKYSRHPNYLGEILMWFGISLYSIVHLSGYYWLLIGAIVNLLMFIFVSIPMAEKHQSSRKEGFEEYKKETRMLFPFKK